MHCVSPFLNPTLSHFKIAVKAFPYVSFIGHFDLILQSSLNILAEEEMS
jgi:hypothetical protein